ncbi:natural killer cell receptor 2B4 isoform X2 [Pan troglodytes]|uniref:natural killer cell receptor 2B4 isoform X2 n=1 Tax=Pan troglodytes TaxID=9598 RepID=UPI003013299C
MLGQVVTLILLLLLKVYQGKGCQGSADNVVSISGVPLQLQPNSTQTKVDNIEWKMWLPSQNEYHHILKWENGSLPSNTSNDRFSFTVKNLSLLIKAAQQQDSGLYCLEVTSIFGKVQTATFQVFVFDKVEKPRLQGQGKILDRGRCQVALSCLVSRDGNVTYAWYRGSKLIQTAGNLTHLEEEVDIDGTHTYTCNVSNPVSWESHTLNLTQDCQNAHQETSPKEFLTIYEDVKDLKTRRNQEQEQTFPGGGSTIYSMIQSQSSAPTSQEPAYTLYSLIQPSRKSGSRKRNHSPSFNSTIYEVIGKSHPKAQNPARLSRKELENFDVYS